MTTAEALIGLAVFCIVFAGLVVFGWLYIYHANLWVIIVLAGLSLMAAWSVIGICRDASKQEEITHNERRGRRPFRNS